MKLKIIFLIFTCIFLLFLGGCQNKNTSPNGFFIAQTTVINNITTNGSSSSSSGGGWINTTNQTSTSLNVRITGITSTATPVTSPISGVPYPLFYINASFTDASAPTLQVGQYVSFTVNPNASWASKVVRGALWDIDTPSANANDIGTLQGGLFQVRHSGSGALNSETGLAVSALSASGSGAISVLTGIQGSSRFSSTGANGQMFGNTNLMTFNVAGTATSITGYQTTLSMTNGATVSGDVLLFNTNNIINTASTITGKTVGYYVGDITAGTQTGGAFAFYNSDSNAPSYFAGKLGIGTTNPGSLLSVTSGASIGSTYALSTAPTNGLIVEGNVGIGTTTPTSKIHVNGDANITNTLQVGRILLSNGTAAAPSLTFTNETGQNSGFYLARDNNAIGLSIAGSQKYLFDDVGLKIGGTGTTSSYPLDLTITGTGIQVVAGYTNAQASAAGVGMEIDFNGGVVRQGTFITAWEDAGSNSYFSFGTRTSGSLTQKWRITGVGHLLPETNNVYDVGNSTQQIRNVYVGTNITVGGNIKGNDYYSGDGTQGWTGTCTILGLTNITVKDGLITGCA